MAVCILCGTNEHAVLLYPANVSEGDLNPDVFSARRLPDRLHGEILRCTRCGLVYPRALIQSEKLAELYQKSKYTYGDQERYIRNVYKRYLKKALMVIRDQPRPWSYLDIGCGNGFMLGAAKELGIENVAGVEPSSDAILRAEDSIRPLLKAGMFSPDLLHGEKFDLISCFQALDHIPDPLRFVEDCRAALKPGGAMLCINHNIGSLTARMLGERCPMIDIEHTYLHTKGTMHMLFARAGFTDIQVFSVRNNYPVEYWMHLLPGPVIFKRIVLTMVKTLWRHHLLIPLYAGNLGLIARRARIAS